jgi:hypothetical protein
MAEKRTMWSMPIILPKALEFLMLKTVIGFLLTDMIRAAPQNKDENIFKRSSFNFTLAIYDIDTNTLYFFELDT